MSASANSSALRERTRGSEYEHVRIVTYGRSLEVLPKRMVSEDRELIRRVLSGDPGAFDGLVRKYNRMAGAIAYAVVGDFSAAEDVVQESLVQAYRSLGTLREVDKFRVWLSGIVRSRAIDWRRRQQARPTVSLDQAFGGGAVGEGQPMFKSGLSSRGAEELYLQEEQRQKILDAVRELGDEDRLVLTLKHMEGLSYREIAEVTGSTVGAVESRLFRARQALRARLDRILR